MEMIANVNARVSLLYVEDDPVARKLTSLLISNRFPGIDIYTAGNGKIGLELFKQYQPDIVLTDLNMPIMDGIRMTREIKAINPAAFIIVVTGCTDTHYLLDAIKIGVKRYVTKPVDHKLLIDAIDDSVARITLERKVREQNAFIHKLSHAVEQSPGTVIITDADGAIEYVNPRFTVLTGYSADEVVGKNPRIFQSGTTSPEIYSDLWHTITSGQDWHGEFQNRNKNGELFWESAAISPIFNETGAITHFVAVKEDISKRKHAEREIEALNKNLADRTCELEITNNSLKGLTADLQATTVKLKERNAELETLKQILEEYTEHLEEKVEERTVALQEEIKERERAEEALRKSEAYLRLQFECMPIGCIVWDAEFRATSCNPAAEEMFGFKSEELVGRNPYGLFVQHNARNQVDAVRRRLLDGEVAVQIEHENITRDGRHLNCVWSNTLLREADGTMTGVISMVRDITDHKRAHKALHVSEERYRTLVDKIDLGITLIDDNHRIITTNAGSCRMLNKSMEDLLNQECFREFEKRTTVCSYCPGTIAMKTGEPATIESVAIRDDGNCFPVRISAYPVFDAEGIATHFIEVVEDISEQKLAAEEQSQLELQLRHSQKMDALGTFAGGIAHDFNNILTAITGYCSLIERKTNEGDPIRLYLAKLQSSTDRASSLVRSLVAYSRKEPFESRPVDLNAIVGKMGDMLSRLLHEDIVFDIKANDRPLIVEADSMQIDQVLMNLVVNARDAMPEGGNLQISVDQVELDHEFIKPLGIDKPGRYACIKVSDTGGGMDEATRERIFEPFFTTKEIGKGTGLGLSIVFGVVRQHKGYINVCSETGKGTAFTIYFPLTDCEEIVTPGEQLFQAKPAPATILLVEDNSEIRAPLKNLLEDEGFTVIEAENGEDGVKKFHEHKDEIELLLLDVVMPKKNGKEAYEEIKMIRPGIRAIFMTGYPVEEHGSDMMLDGNVDFIFKPVAINNLMRKVQEMQSCHSNILS